MSPEEHRALAKRAVDPDFQGAEQFLRSSYELDSICLAYAELVLDYDRLRRVARLTAAYRVAYRHFMAAEESEDDSTDEMQVLVKLGRELDAALAALDAKEPSDA